MQGIVREVLSTTPNGKVAGLKFIGEISPQIQKAIENKEGLKHLPYCGTFSTDFGNLSYLFVAFDAQENFDNPDADVYMFDFILNPANFLESSGDNSTFYKEWLAAIHGQETLCLVIPSGPIYRLTVILEGNQLAEYIHHLDESIANWSLGDNYKKAVEFSALWELRIHARKNVASINRQPVATGHRILLMDFLRSCRTFLSSDEQLCKWANDDEKTKVINDQLEDRLTQIEAAGDWNSLSEIAEDESENLIRDWLFAHRCLTQSKKTAMVAIGLTDGGGWAWRKMWQSDDVWEYSRSYRALLFDRHWQRLLNEQDIPLKYLDLHLVADLSKVPQRSAFGEIGVILKQAITHKCYGIAAGTTIIVGKLGFDSISFAPLDKESRHCIFKIVVSANNSGRNLCLFGKLDAALGTIEALGIRPNLEAEKPLNLLLFIAATAYYDCLVAREEYEFDDKQAKKSSSRKKGKSRRHQSQLPWLARLKSSSNQIGERFADPDDFLVKLKRRCLFRSEHLRDLPDGHKASDKQKQLAKVYGVFVPEGFTFVSPSSSGGIPEAEAIQYRSLSLMKLLLD